MFQARLTGAERCSGGYIAFLDSDDYVPVDFYRSLVFALERRGADMAIGNVVEERNGKKEIFNLAESEINFDTLEGEEILKRYFAQTGHNYFWQTISNRVIAKNLWNAVLPWFRRQEKHLIMCEDILYSTIFFLRAKKIVKSGSAIFYCRNEDSVTVSTAAHYKKLKKAIDDISTVFSFLETYMTQAGVYETYKSDFSDWRIRYRQMYRDTIRRLSSCKSREKAELYKMLDGISAADKEIPNAGYFYSIKTEWNPRYEEIKRMICDPSIKYISFDIFDTLLVRPFMDPPDLFYLLDDYFRELTGQTSFADFSSIRQEAEQRAREKIHTLDPTIEDITLDEIYSVLKDEYKLSAASAEAMKEKEIETELRFCNVRASAFELYEMAVYLGKKIICVSDMYLPEAVIKRILEKNGYANIDKIYVSSETRLRKGSGAMYRHILEELGVSGDTILHIGDNCESDFNAARNAGLNAVHFVKTTDAFRQNGSNYRVLEHIWRKQPALRFWSIRTMIALAANRYFDNPFRSFNGQSDYNGDPELLGYSALGMFLFGLTQWLIRNFQEKRYDTAVFCARDGWIPMRAFQILKNLYHGMPEEKYLPVSRQALIPLSIRHKNDCYKLKEIVLWWGKTPRDMLPFLRRLFDINDLELECICGELRLPPDEKFASPVHYDRLITVCFEHYFDEAWHRAKLEKLRDWFAGFFRGRSCAFDIGYSAKPEMFISALLDKPVDAYFIHGNEVAHKHARIGGFNLYTWLDYVPNVYGVVDELFISEIAPSCVGYDSSGETVAPVYEGNITPYQDAFFIKKAQEAALDFVSDIKNMFDGEIGLFAHPDYYSSLLLRAFVCDPEPFDQRPLAHWVFENALAFKKIFLVDWWNEIRGWESETGLPVSATLPEKFAYYFALDRRLLKEKIKTRLERHKILLGLMRFTYKAARKTRNFFRRVRKTDG